MIMIATKTKFLLCKTAPWRPEVEIMLKVNVLISEMP